MTMNKALATLLIGAFGVNFLIMQKMFALIGFGMSLVFSVVMTYVDNMDHKSKHDFNSRFNELKQDLDTLSSNYETLSKKIKQEQAMRYQDDD